MCTYIVYYLLKTKSTFLPNNSAKLTIKLLLTWKLYDHLKFNVLILFYIIFLNAMEACLQVYRKEVLVNGAFAVRSKYVKEQMNIEKLPSFLWSLWPEWWWGWILSFWEISLLCSPLLLSLPLTSPLQHGKKKYILHPADWLLKTPYNTQGELEEEDLK